MADSHDQHEKIFLDIFETYSDAIYRHCLFRVNDHDTAVDLTQDIFLKAWNHYTTGQEIRNWKAFLYRVARNRIIDTYRSAARTRNVSLDDLMENGFDVGVFTEEVGVEARHALDVLKKSTQADKELIIMRYVEGLTPGEIADILGINVNAASVRLNRAVKKFKKEIGV
jgi:RNA polymerase sigma factor (sigma-70 family)